MTIVRINLNDVTVAVTVSRDLVRVGETYNIWLGGNLKSINNFIDLQGGRINWS